MDNATAAQAHASSPTMDPGWAGFPGGDAISRVTADMVKDGMAFAAERLRADSRMLEEMCACGNLADLAVLQQRWMTDAFRSYSDVTTRMLGHAVALAAPAPGEAPPGAPTKAARRAASPAAA